MEQNGTWYVVSLPLRKTPIGCKWVFKNKHIANGTLSRNKARLVAKGYTQQEDIYFHDVFSLIAKLVTIKMLLALVASQN